MEKFQQNFLYIIGGFIVGLVVSSLNKPDCEDGLEYFLLFVLTTLYFFISGSGFCSVHV